MEPLLYIDNAVNVLSEIVETTRDTPLVIREINIPSNSAIFIDLTVIGLRYTVEACLYKQSTIVYRCLSDGSLVEVFNKSVEGSEMFASISFDSSTPNVLQVIVNAEADVVNKWRSSLKTTIVNTDSIPT